MADLDSKKVDKFMNSLTWRKKINQMAQIHVSLLNDKTDRVDVRKIEYYFGELGVGSLLLVPFQEYRNASEYREMIIAIRNVTDTYNLPPVLVGIDSVHGANYIRNAVFMPQQLNIAATWNQQYSKYAGMVAARDSRAAGIPWIFSPIVGLGIQPLWPRIYETFGEDPYVVGIMAKAMIDGIQINDETNAGTPKRSAACAKHFIGYSNPITGHDRSPSWIPVRHLYQYFVRPWIDVIQGANVFTVMESYSEYDGVPNVAYRESLRRLLRNKLQFKGVLVTDYHEIENLVEFHHIAVDNNEAIALSLSEGSLDISMIPFNAEGWLEGSLNFIDSGGKLHEDRINESVRRILDLKHKLGLFEEIFQMNDVNLDKLGSTEDRLQAATIARESLILAKNHADTLPLPQSERLKVHVTGPTSDSIRFQTGGWSVHWQGGYDEDEFDYGTTVKTAASNVKRWDVSHSCGVDILGNSCDIDDSEVFSRNQADYIIICIGEENYTEKPGDIRDLSLRKGQIDFVNSVKSATNGKIVVVYFGGRPRLLKNVAQIADAIILAFLPGPDGGQGVVDLISGAYSPSGRLPITYPKYHDGGGVPYWGSVTELCTGENEDILLPNYSYIPCEVEYPFGHGLTYTTFEYKDFFLDSFELILDYIEGSHSEINVSVKVRNIGNVAAFELVTLYLFDESRGVTPEYKRLIYFERIWLEPGSESSIKTKIGIDHMRFIGPHDDKQLVIQQDMRSRVGVGNVDCRRDPKNNYCSDYIYVKSRDGLYNGSCDIACTLWRESKCLEDLNMSIEICWRKCLSAHSSTYGEIGWGFNYVECVEQILLDERQNDKCHLMTTLCRDVFETKNGISNVSSPYRVSTVMVPLIAGVIGVLFMLRPFFREKKRYRKADGIEFTQL